MRPDGATSTGLLPHKQHSPKEFGTSVARTRTRDLMSAVSRNVTLSELWSAVASYVALVTEYLSRMFAGTPSCIAHGGSEVTLF